MNESQQTADSLHGQESSFINVPFRLNRFGGLFSDRIDAFARAHHLPIDRDVSRQELISLGYSLVNQVGEGERVLIQECTGENWRDKALLTKDEVELSKAETCPKELSPDQLKQIAADMEVFIDEVQIASLVNMHLGPRGLSQNNNRLALIIRHFELTGKASEADLYDLDKRMSVIEEAQEAVLQEYPTLGSLRGIPTSQLTTRGESKVNGHRCPMLECPHVFENSGGVLIYDREGKIAGRPLTLRLNSVVAHLAEHGISETGDADHDQRYISIQEYLPLFERRAEGEQLHGLDERMIGLKVFVEATKRFLVELGINTISEDELVKFGKERLFFIKD